MFRPGLEEVVVGRLANARIAHLAVGDRIKLAGRAWSVVGVFDAQGTSFDSEIWGDVELFMPVFDRPVYQSVTFRLDDPRPSAPSRNPWNPIPACTSRGNTGADFNRRQPAPWPA